MSWRNSWLLNRGPSAFMIEETPPGPASMSLFAELKRRNVVRVAMAYGVVAWLLAQVADLLFSAFGAPEWAMRTFIILLLLGFPIALVFAWAF